MIERIQIIHGDFREAIYSMPDESVGRVFKALFAFASDEDTEPILGEDELARAVFPIIKQQMLRNEEYRQTKAESGKKGGLAKASKGVASRSKAKQSVAKTSKAEQSLAPSPSPSPNPNPINKRQYGVRENVLLTDEEHTKIVSAGYTELIDELSLYIDSKGVKYKSHYSTILAWARRREKEKKENVVSMSGANAKSQFNRFEQRSDYDFEALEKKLIKN